ncbi:hypothetical protein [Candidatus Nitrospira bockiana]
MTKSISYVPCLLILFGALTLGSKEALAEPFVDLYMGGSFTNNTDVEVPVAGLGTATLKDVRFSSSIVGGGRAGIWLPHLRYMGFAIDGFYFTTNIKPQTMQACAAVCATLTTTGETEQRHIGVSLDLMLRWPVAVDEDFPNGRVYPYLAVGPAIFFSTWKEPGFTEARTATVGFKGGGGGKFLITKRVGLFAEYRVTYFKPEQEFTAGTLSFSASNQLITHHAVGGVSILFN